MNTMERCACRALLLAMILACTAPALAQNPRKVNPAKLYNYWVVLDQNVSVDVPNSGLNLDKPGCAAVTYVIGSNGVPQNLQVVKVVPKSGLGPAALSAVSHFHYGPSLTNGSEQPVATYYVVPFNTPSDKAQQQQIMAPCQLPGYDQG